MKTILAFLLILTLVVSGCTTNTPEDNLNTIGDAELTQSETDTIDTPIDNNANAKLKGILSSAVKYKVVYDITSAGTTSQMTQYMSDNKVRIDMSVEDMEIRSYYMNNEYIVCNQATGDWMCQKMTYTPSATDDVKNNVDTYNVQSIGTKMVAGMTTDCYGVTTTDGTVEYCYSNDNVPLYIKTTSSMESTEMIATSYSTSVSDSDFIAPVESTVIPDINSEYNIPYDIGE